MGAATCAMSLPSAANPITVEEVVRITPGGTVRGLLATVDLTDPRVQIVTTGTSTGACGDATLTTVPSWRTAVAADLAINANFFSTCSGTRADIVGLAFADGVEVSPARRYQPTSVPDPAITFTQSRVAAIEYVAPGTTAGIWDGVAGVGPSNTDADPGTMLITDGVNTGATARVTPLTREPRTAVAVNRAGTTLYMLVIDGRQATWSVGMTLPEVADLFLERGAWRAINLDGGGSSSFVYRRPDNSIQQNRPSDSGNVHRAVSNHLGIKLAASTVTDRWERPIRGVWMRPPGSIGTGYPNGANFAVFESTVQTLAANGIRDVYLETLFWGRDSGVGNSSNFPSRFGTTDYLSQAIVIAARYGVRIHSWCETGYLDFGSSPSAFLAANPSFVVKHVSVARNEATDPDPCATPSTFTGDLANQRFVNLGNPGVRGALNEYFANVASRYPGLAGIQADYHFFPLGDAPANTSNNACWSYDPWTLSNFRDAGGTLVNPLPFAVNCTGNVTINGTTGVISSGAHPNLINFHRANITEALVQLRASTQSAAPTIAFSSVSFGAWDSALHVSKAIDLPSWGTQMGTQSVFIMAYQTSTTGIRNELQFAQTALPGRRVVAGLANLTNTTRPTITQQLDAMRARGIEDFCWFDAPTFINNPAFLTQLSTWLNTTGAAQVGDINRDGFIDARDRSLFSALFTGAPITTTAGTVRYDLNNDGTINAEDLRLLNRQFSRWRFGEDGVVDMRDLQALRNSFVTAGTPGPSTPLNLYDLNGDGSVNLADEQMLYGFATVPLNLPPDTDVNRDGVVDVRDLVEQLTGVAVDVNRDGVINADDATALVNVLRAGEPGDVNQR
ncbi:MAG: phosphodiester glycosidase family protein [Phycisphaerales bacterium]|nr:phosphodiester glycosidase family protein [Phycisphaerales bacterium]